MASVRPCHIHHREPRLGPQKTLVPPVTQRAVVDVHRVIRRANAQGRDLDSC